MANSPLFQVQYSPYDDSYNRPYDPYDLYKQPPNDIPLVPNRLKAPPELLQKPSSRTGQRPRYLSLSEASDFDESAHLKPSPSFTDDSFLQTPPSSLFPRGIPKPPRQHPFAQNFEPPEWMKIFVHVLLCVFAYPILLVFVVIAREKTLFWTRFAVSIGCGLMGFLLGWSLLRLARSFMEAATWATLIHQSRVADAPGVRLRDLAASASDPNSPFMALRLLWSRWMYTGTARRHRKTYDKRPWTLVIFFFLLLVIAAGALPFIFGRIVTIDTTVRHQRETYYETTVKGDLSTEDIEKGVALVPVFNDFALTWTLSPFSAHGSLPSAISFPFGNESVYFAETTQSQLLPKGSGFGTFDTSTTAPSIELDSNAALSDNSGNSVDPGSLLRYPRWGIRIHCEKIPDGNINIIPRSQNGLTYLFTPRDVLRSLYSSFDMEFPSELEMPVNTTEVLHTNDTVPSTIDISTIALAAAFSDNGVAHSLKSVPMTVDTKGDGWVSIESVMVRLNTTYAPNGNFSVYSDLPVLTKTGEESRIGYDAAVCVELYEPYIVETYNSTVGLPSSTGIISKGGKIIDVDAENIQEKNTGATVSGQLIRELNSTNLSDVYGVLHGNSVNQIIKDNGRDAFYVPSPTIVSFTSGQGPTGYTELSPLQFGQARALGDASNVLPYFAGSADTLARCYPDRELSSAHINPITMGCVLGIVLVLGLVAGLFVPKLPLQVPKRGFELYSWLAAFRGEELTMERSQLEKGMEKSMDLQDMQKKMGDLRFRYAF